MVVLTVLLLSAMVYVQLMVGHLAHSRSQAWFTRIMLLAVGVGFGWALASVYFPTRGVGWVWVFLAGVGAVHVPTAIIVLIKRQRKKERGTL